MCHWCTTPDTLSRTCTESLCKKMRTVATRYVIYSKCIPSEQVNMNCPPPLGTRFYNFQPYTDRITSNSYLLDHRRWCHLANTLKHNANKRTAQISTLGIAIVSQHAARLFQTTPYDRLILSNSWAIFSSQAPLCDKHLYVHVLATGLYMQRRCLCYYIRRELLAW